MKRATKFLIGKHDFSAFRSTHCQAKMTSRSIDKIIISKNTIALKLELKENLSCIIK